MLTRAEIAKPSVNQARGSTGDSEAKLAEVHHSPLQPPTTSIKSQLKWVVRRTRLVQAFIEQDHTVGSPFGSSGKTFPAPPEFRIFLGEKRLPVHNSLAAWCRFEGDEYPQSVASRALQSVTHSPPSAYPRYNLQRTFASKSRPLGFGHSDNLPQSRIDARGSSRCASLILSHHAGFVCECNEEDTTDRRQYRGYVRLKESVVFSRKKENRSTEEECGGGRRRTRRRQRRPIDGR